VVFASHIRSKFAFKDRWLTFLELPAIHRSIIL
jgi:hypothetical protein